MRSDGSGASRSRPPATAGRLAVHERSPWCAKACKRQGGGRTHDAGLVRDFLTYTIQACSPNSSLTYYRVESPISVREGGWGGGGRRGAVRPSKAWGRRGGGRGEGAQSLRRKPSAAALVPRCT